MKIIKSKGPEIFDIELEKDLLAKNRINAWRITLLGFSPVICDLRENPLSIKVRDLLQLKQKQTVC